MKQQCYLVAIYCNWLLFVCGTGYLLLTHRYSFAIAWLVILPLAMWAYIRVFPSLSSSMGYGKVDDDPAHESRGRHGSAPAKVTIYTALGCPFCPIVERRLQALQKSMAFEIEKIDVTLRPDLLASKGIRAVPVIEVGERRMEGNATSEQLSRLIFDTPTLASPK